MNKKEFFYGNWISGNIFPYTLSEEEKQEEEEMSTTKRCPSCKYIKTISKFSLKKENCDKCFRNPKPNSNKEQEEEYFISRWENAGKTTPTFYDKLSDSLWQSELQERCENGEMTMGTNWSIGKKTSYKGSIQQYGLTGIFKDSDGIPIKGKIDLDEIFKDFPIK
jgi:hypothetical protein